MQLLVIADDFTGALDTGIQFARHGIATTLFLSDALTAGLLADCQADVVVADTESRHLPPEDAAARVRAVTRLAKAAGCPVFYKKTDSTLRGNLGAELAAMQDVCGAKRLWFAPAYPALGRTTRGGTQLVNGVPLARTDFAADPFNPVRTDFVPALLAEQTDRPVRIAAPAALPPEADRPELVVFDAETDAELLQTAQALWAHGEAVCLAGCAGFAAALETVLDLPRTAQVPELPNGSLLLVCGSVHPRAVAQCRYAAAHCGYPELPLTAAQMLSDTGDDAKTLDTLCTALERSGRALLRVSGGRECLAETAALAARLSIDPQTVPARIAARLGALTAQVLARKKPAALIVFGGDTLLGIARALGCTSVTPLAELLPGIVLSQMQTDTGALFVVTKAGGFGDENLLQEIECRLHTISTGG